MRVPKFWKAYFWVFHPLQKLFNYHGRQSNTLLMRYQKKICSSVPVDNQWNSVYFIDAQYKSEHRN